VLNNGTLDMDRCVVTNNLVTTSGVDFWKGGAGVYNGGGSTFRLTNSAVSNNTTTGADGGGIYAFFGTTVEIENSTVSGNVASNVGGGIGCWAMPRCRNSTLSGNSSLAWQRLGAVPHRRPDEPREHDGDRQRAPPGDLGAGVVGTFTAASATLNLVNSIVAGNNRRRVLSSPLRSERSPELPRATTVFRTRRCSRWGATSFVGDALLGPLAGKRRPIADAPPDAGSPAIDDRRGAVPGTDPARRATRTQGGVVTGGQVEAETGGPAGLNDPRLTRVTKRWRHGSRGSGSGE